MKRLSKLFLMLCMTAVITAPITASAGKSSHTADPVVEETTIDDEEVPLKKITPEPNNLFEMVFIPGMSLLILTGVLVKIMVSSPKQKNQSKA